jgi:transcriptional regulator with XRE-family HTH domain
MQACGEYTMSKPRPIDQRHHIGGLIKQERMKRGWSLHEVAEAVEISASHLGRLERGLVSPSYVLVDRLSRHLGIELTDVQEYDRRARAINARLIAAFEGSDIDEKDKAEILGISLEGRERLLELIDRKRE